MSINFHIGPSGQNVPARMIPSADGKGFDVEYTPREVGEFCFISEYFVFSRNYLVT